MGNIHKGCLVKSIAGRDAGQIFYVIDIESDRVSIADGNWHKIAKPKKKNLRHLVFYSENTNQRILNKINSNLKLEDAELRKALRLFLSEEANNG